MGIPNPRICKTDRETALHRLTDARPVARRAYLRTQDQAIGILTVFTPLKPISPRIPFRPLTTSTYPPENQERRTASSCYALKADIAAHAFQADNDFVVLFIRESHPDSRMRR